MLTVEHGERAGRGLASSRKNAAPRVLEEMHATTTAATRRPHWRGSAGATGLATPGRAAVARAPQSVRIAGYISVKLLETTSSTRPVPTALPW